MRFEVTIPARSRRVKAHRIDVEAENWMVALREGLAELDLPPMVMSRVLCDIQPDGAVVLQDTELDRRIEVRPLNATRPGGVRPTRPREDKPGTPTLTYLDAQVISELRQRAAAGGAKPTPPNSKRFSPPLPFFQIPPEVSEELRRVYKAPKTTPPPPPTPPPLEEEGEVRPVSTREHPRFQVKRPVRYLPYVEVKLPPRGRISFMNLDLSDLHKQLGPKQKAAAKVPRGPEGAPPAGADPDYRIGWVRESVAALGRHAKDLEAFIEGLLQLTIAAIPSRMAWILLATPDGRELTVSGAAGEGARHFLGRRITGDRDLASVCVQGGISIRISDLQKSRHPVSLMPNQDASLERSVLCSPLIHDHYVIGALQLLGSIRDASFHREDLDLLEGLCRSAALLLRRFELSVDHSLP